MPRLWRLKDIDAESIVRLTRELGVRVATARCLLGRGISDAAVADRFLNPRLGDLRRPDGPSGIADFDRAVERIGVALNAGQRIGVFGDYDVDGVTTCALLAEFLEAVGADVVSRVARRDAGYGFGEADARWFSDEGATLIITCDTGTSDVPAILAARARGVDVIVLDHHQVPEGPDHPAVALVNPHRADSAYGFRGFASVGLGFMLAATLRTYLKARGWFSVRPEPDPRTLLDLVAVGTIADMAPLRDENRVLVAHGLRRLSSRQRPGFAALLDRAQVEPGRQLDETDVSWKIGPRLNAPGRLGAAEPALELLRCRDLVSAVALADECEQKNDRRRELQEACASEALAQAEALVAERDPAGLVVAGAGWHPGVVGIVAAKLVDRFGRAAVVVALEEAQGLGRGSVRSAAGVDVYQALKACASLCVRYGGHAQAAGLTVSSENVAPLAEGFAQAVSAQLGAGRGAADAVQVDAEVGLDEVDERLAGEVQSLAPFGPGNLAPLLAVRGARVRGSRRVGDGSHLKLDLECAKTGMARSAIAFRMGERDPGAGATIDVTFRPEVSVWRGTRRVELNVHDLRQSGG